MYYGEFTVSIDEKGRITVPRKTRETMEVLKHIVWYLTRGFVQSIFLFHSDEWNKIRQHVARFSAMDAKVLDFRRLFFSSVAEARLDNQGRIAIPSHLRDHAHLDKEAVLIGVEDHLELWSKDSWRSFVDSKYSEYKAMAIPVFSSNGVGNGGITQEGLGEL